MRAQNANIVKLGRRVLPLAAGANNRPGRNAKTIRELGFALALFRTFSRHSDFDSQLAVNRRKTKVNLGDSRFKSATLRRRMLVRNASRALNWSLTSDEHEDHRYE